MSTRSAVHPGGPKRARGDEPRFGARLVVLALAAICGATLPPGPPDPGGIPVFCLRCGPTDLADALQNVLLFAPLGLGLALRGTPALRALGIGALVSLAIELAQLLIPGRDPSARDVGMNALGAALGAIALDVARMLASARAKEAGLLAVASALAGLATLVFGARLFVTELTPRPWYGGWSIDLAHLVRWQGTVLRAEVGGAPLPIGRVPDAAAETIHAALLSSAPLHIEAVAGPRPHDLAPILTIHDDAQQEVMLLGADGDDLVWRLRTRAVAWSLEEPEVRLDGLLAGIEPGARLSIAVTADRIGRCFEIGERRRCGVAPGASRAWSAIVGGGDSSQPARRTVDAIALALLALPVGLALRPTRAGSLAVALATASPWIASAAGPVRPPYPGEVVGLWLGVAAGVGLARWLRGEPVLGARAPSSTEV